MYIEDYSLNSPDLQKCRRLLENLSHFALIRLTEKVMDLLTPADNMNYPIENYANGYEDHNGRVMYVLALLRDRRFDRSRIPLLDPVYKKPEFSRNIDFSYLLPKKKEQPVEQYYEPVQAPTSKIVYVTNPRWEHKKKEEGEVEVENNGNDEKEKKEGIASIGDTVVLMVDIKNCPEGAEVVFDIYDMSIDPPKKIDKTKGKHNKGLGKGEWVVTCKSEAGEVPQLAFEATARSRTSDKKSIDLKKADQFTVRLHIDPTTKEAQDDRYILISDDESFQMIKTVKDDQIPGDDCLDLMFSGIEDERLYTLIVDPGKEGDPYLIFKDVLGSQLVNDEKIEHSDTEQEDNTATQKEPESATA